jgi:hypothetical protein
MTALQTQVCLALPGISFAALHAPCRVRFFIFILGFEAFLIIHVLLILSRERLVY